jgi:mannose-6-phosphate isomerase
MGWDGPWRPAVEHGLAFLRERQMRPDGLILALVALDGTPADETAMLYDQAFGLFALAAAQKALPDRDDIEPLARRLLDVLRDERSHAAGGYLELGAEPYQANAHMHLLEAALAWAEISDDPVWDETADAVVALALARFIDPDAGFLREFFDAEWRPRQDESGRLIEPGHQFEWAWLLARWGRLRGREDASEAARRLFETGLRGVDPVRNVAVNALWDDLTMRDPHARLWPQTERLKAAVWLAPNEPDHALAAIRGLTTYFDLPVKGLWRDKLRADGAFVAEDAPASSFYHIVCAIAVLRQALDDGSMGAGGSSMTDSG